MVYTRPEWMDQETWDYLHIVEVTWRIGSEIVKDKYDMTSESDMETWGKITADTAAVCLSIMPCGEKTSPITSDEG